MVPDDRLCNMLYNAIVDAMDWLRTADIDIAYNVLTGIYQYVEEEILDDSEPDEESSDSE